MIGPALKDGLTLHLSGEIISRPYINLTLQLMQDFGAKAAWTSPNSISVAPQLYLSIPFKVESDWSAASYWYQIAALSPKVEIELLWLFHNSYQGDSRGADIYWELTFPFKVISFPFNSAPLIHKGGYPSWWTYSISAPNSRSALTNICIGRCCIRAVPVIVRSPGVTLK